MALIANPDIEVIIEATGDPATGIRLCLAAIAARQAHRHGQRRGRCAGRPAAGAARAREGRRLLAGVGRPAGAHLRARRLGARVRLRGRRRRQGHALPPDAITSPTPDTVWDDPRHSTCKIKDRSHINPKMFNSFIDGTKSGIEMTAVCNATGLRAADRTASPSRRRRASSWPRCASRGATAARWRRRA